MADLVKKIRTTSGDLQIDYNALANKPTVESLGAVSKSGDTINGDLTIDRNASSALILKTAKNNAGYAASSRIYKNANSTTDYGLIIRDFTNGDHENNNSLSLMVANSRSNLSEKVQIINQINGESTYYKLYGEHNKPALSDLGVNATATELNYVDGVTSSIQTQLNGKAASSHEHSAGNITSGTLAIGRGGTGITSNPSMLTNLGSTSAASVFAASPRPGVTGTLPIANGGTGATTAAAARTNLGISDYVTEQGTSGNTYYRKWSSGIMEQWYAVTSSSQGISTKYGDTPLYYGTHTWTFPVAFTKVDIAICSCFRFGTGVSWGASWGATTTNVTLCGYDYYSRAAGSDTCHITAYAKGRWK